MESSAECRMPQVAFLTYKPVEPKTGVKLCLDTNILYHRLLICPGIIFEQNCLFPKVNISVPLRLYLRFSLFRKRGLLKGFLQLLKKFQVHKISHDSFRKSNHVWKYLRILLILYEKYQFFNASSRKNVQSTADPRIRLNGFKNQPSKSIA